MGHYIEVLDRSVRHQQPMLKIKRLFVGCCTVDSLPNKSGVVRMHTVEDDFDRDPGRRVVLEYSVVLLGPDNFSARDVPAKTAGVAKPLRLRQIGLVPPQGLFRALAVLNVGCRLIPSDDLS